MLHNIAIPDDVLSAARLSPDEIKVELALTLYAQKRLSLGKARELAGLSLVHFRQLLAVRKIPAHYEASDLAVDVQAVADF